MAPFQLWPRYLRRLGHEEQLGCLPGLAASLGAGISMGFAEALSDDGSLTGRGHPWARGLICGAMTTLGGIGHTLPFLVLKFRMALGIAIAVVLVELGIITWVRHRFMDTPVFSARYAGRTWRSTRVHYGHPHRKVIEQPREHGARVGTAKH
jgi:hypothetical protein